MDTKTKILDAAQTLIVELGAEKASMRKITEEAGVNVAAINYHFGSKDNLISAIVSRFLEPLEEDQRKRLNTMMQQENLPRLEEIIRSQLIPLYEFTVQNPDWMNVFHQLAHAYENEGIFKQNLKSMVQEKLIYLAECIAKVIPEMPKETLHRRIVFFRLSAFAMMQGECVREETIEILGVDSDPEIMMDDLVRYIAAGIRA